MMYVSEDKTCDVNMLERLVLVYGDSLHSRIPKLSSVKSEFRILIQMGPKTFEVNSRIPKKEGVYE